MTITIEELKNGMRALEAATQKLNYADDVDLIDAAVFEIAAARKRLNYLFKIAKKEVATP